jgi:hypothetical protein
MPQRYNGHLSRAIPRPVQRLVGRRFVSGSVSPSVFLRLSIARECCAADLKLDGELDSLGDKTTVVLRHVVYETVEAIEPTESNVLTTRCLDREEVSLQPNLFDLNHFDLTLLVEPVTNSDSATWQHLDLGWAAQSLSAAKNVINTTSRIRSCFRNVRV